MPRLGNFWPMTPATLGPPGPNLRLSPAATGPVWIPIFSFTSYDKKQFCKKM